MQKTDLQFVTDVVRAAATLMDRTGGYMFRITLLPSEVQNAFRHEDA